MAKKKKSTAKDSSGFVKKPTEKGGKGKKGSLQKMRDWMIGLINEANARVSQLIGRNSRAMHEAQRTILPSRRERVEKGELELFSISDKTRYRELSRELGRVQEFLADPTSNPQMSDQVNRQIAANAAYEGAFGAYPDYGGRIDEDLAKAAFEIYRRVKELNADIIYDEGGYGSSNLINYIYQEVADRAEGASWLRHDALVEGITPEIEIMLESYRDKIVSGSFDPTFSKSDFDYTSPESKAQQKLTKAEFWSRMGWDD